MIVCMNGHSDSIILFYYRLCLQQRGDHRACVGLPALYPANPYIFWSLGFPSLRKKLVRVEYSTYRVIGDKRLKQHFDLRRSASYRLSW